MRALASLALLASACAGGAGYLADGRMPLDRLYGRFESLSRDPAWVRETVYSYGGEEPPVLAWRTARTGRALWILAGIHGEEPAGPNAAARSLEAIAALARRGTPVVLIPLCNPKGYRNNWRYPNTPERDWRKGGYSVGDAEYLLADPRGGGAPRAEKPPGPDTEALTAYVLRLARTHPPALALDLHEDELSAEGGYIYSQGTLPDAPAGPEVIRRLRSSGIPIRLSGRTRFGQAIRGGMITGDEDVRDGSIDELLAADQVLEGGRRLPGPAAESVIVVETPAYSGSKLEERVRAHASVLDGVEALWALHEDFARKRGRRD